VVEPTIVPVPILTLDDGRVTRLVSAHRSPDVLPSEDLPALEGPAWTFARLDSDHWLIPREPAVFVLGPAVDPMRCRALPSEREWVAVMVGAGVALKVRPGVWVAGPFGGRAERRRAGEPDLRDARAIENRVFEPREMAAPIAEMPEVLRRLRERGT
jgi:hypothetical protein